MPNSRGLDNNKEQVIVDHILELDARGFGPWLADVAAMANSLRAERNLGPVGTNWPSTFVKRQLELKVKFNWKYDYKRAKCEDPKAIPPFIIFKACYHLTGWYKEEDLPQDWVIGVSSNGWTTNELGFEWLKHFDRHTKERTYKKQQGSSPNSVLSALEHYAKGGAILSHKLVLAQQQIAELQAANEAATRQKSHKRKQVQKEGTLIVEDGQRLAALKEFRARGDRKRAKKQASWPTGESATFAKTTPKPNLLWPKTLHFGSL
ncbi:hypothetical protein OPT61_g5673 [Boeremia exigua]|uniref:Uncharacterized protein n=1 Tax=Boeremia exigua TaxID=749465 RepID=A0ACC2I9K8_9PLEO|nr:hypothetical protein OPT61_g5673 [Boeremia exigua]